MQYGSSKGVDQGQKVLTLIQPASSFANRPTSTGPPDLLINPADVFTRRGAAPAGGARSASAEPPGMYNRFFYKLVAKVGPKFFSIYDGTTEYKLGEVLRQTVRPNNGGGYYVSGTPEAAMRSSLPEQMQVFPLPPDYKCTSFAPRTVATIQLEQLRTRLPEFKSAGSRGIRSYREREELEELMKSIQKKEVTIQNIARKQMESIVAKPTR